MFEIISNAIYVKSIQYKIINEVNNYILYQHTHITCTDNTPKKHLWGPLVPPGYANDDGMALYKRQYTDKTLTL